MAAARENADEKTRKKNALALLLILASLRYTPLSAVDLIRLLEGILPDGTISEEARAAVGDRPIAIDYTFCPRPLGLAKLLLGAGMNVQRVYLDTVTGEERAAFEYLREHHPDLMLYPTVHAAMRFHSPGETSDFVAIGQKAAHFTNTPHFVNVVEGGGMLGYQAVEKTMELLAEAAQNPKDMRALLEDLCTQKEVENMAERIFAAKLLLEGKTYNEVVSQSNISSATLSRVSRSLQNGTGYKKQLKK